MIRLTFSIALLCCLSTSVGWAQNSEAMLRVASISFQPVKFDLKKNAETLETWFRKAAAGGAEIAVAPEGALEGYVVNEIILGEVNADRMREVAVSVDSPVIQRFQSLARELKMCLVFGFAEKMADEVFNCAIFIDHHGQICGKYHKMQFHEGYHDSWWFNRLGRRSRAFDTPYGRCGMMICNDRWNPLLAKIPALDGAQFLVIPAFGSTSKHQDEAILKRAVETNLPLIEANVGVSLIVSSDQIVASQRQPQGIVFGEISIPPERKIDKRSRDRVQRQFMAWRAEEMPVRRKAFLQQRDPRGPAHDHDVAVLTTSELEVVIGNNRSLKKGEVNHKAGYNGIFSITSEHQSESPFVPAYAGLNLEHYFDGRPRGETEVFFEPRFWTMRLRRINDRTIELYQPPTPTYEVESWMRLTAQEPNYIDFNYRCVPHRDDYKGDFFGVFWASYINGPLDKSIYFLDGESTLENPLWRQFCTQQHDRDSTVRSADDEIRLNFETSDALFASVSPLRFSVPFFYGRFRNMVLIYVFRPNSNIRLTHSPSGGGRSASGDDTNPAWDFQMIVPEPEEGREYRLAGRLIYKRWQGRADVLKQVRMFLNSPESSKSTDNVQIQHGDLAVAFRDNSLSPRRLSGIASLRNLKHAPDFDAFDPDSVGASAGLNFEHIISGHKNPDNKFTPRHGPYRLFATGAQSVKLVRRPSDSPWKVGSELSYRIVEPHYIDFEFRCTPEDAARFGERGYAIFFFANYMNDVISPALRFRGHRSAGSPEEWIVAEAPKGPPDWMSGGNYRGRQADELEYGADV